MELTTVWILEYVDYFADFGVLNPLRDTFRNRNIVLICNFNVITL
jgi:hypothetical protein